MLTESIIRATDLSLWGDQVCPLCGSRDLTDALKAPDRFHMRKTMYQIVECRACSFAWLSNPPASQDSPYHYGKDYHKHITASGEVKLERRWRAPRKRLLEMSCGGKLLDIGCSSGGFLRALKGGPWDLYGIEVSPAEARRAEETSGAKVFIGTVLDASFPPLSFDVITCFHILEHVHQLSEVVQALHTWLKPGGVVLLQVPNFRGLEARIFRSYWYGLELPRHLHHFSPQSLNRLFVSQGFEVERLRTLPDCYVEKSIRYLFDDVFSNVGFDRPPLASVSGTKSFPWRVVRKAFRMVILWPIRGLAAAIGRGPAIEGVFRRKHSYCGEQCWAGKLQAIAHEHTL